MISIFAKPMIAYKEDVIREECNNGTYQSLAFAIKDYNRAVKRFKEKAARNHAVILEKYPTGTQVAFNCGVVLG